MYIYTREYYAAIKRWDFAICDNIVGPLEGTMLSEIRLRKTNTIWLYSWNLNKQNKWINKMQNQTCKYGEQIDGCERKGG